MLSTTSAIFEETKIFFSKNLPKEFKEFDTISKIHRQRMSKLNKILNFFLITKKFFVFQQKKVQKFHL
jgi:hypothetical protein